MGGGGGGERNIEACQKCNSLCFLSDDTFHCVSVSGCFESAGSPHLSLTSLVLVSFFFPSSESFDTEKINFSAGV